jgi:hypothetical protein
MPTNLLSKSVPRVDIDQRSREARLRIEQVERLLSRAALKLSAVRRLLYLCSGGIFSSASRKSRTRWPLSNRRPSRMPTIHDVWVEECGSFCRASDLSLCHLLDEGCGGDNPYARCGRETEIFPVRPGANSERSRRRRPRRPRQPEQPSCRTSPRSGYARTASAGSCASFAARGRLEFRAPRDELAPPVRLFAAHAVCGPIGRLAPRPVLMVR